MNINVFKYSLKIHCIVPLLFRVFQQSLFWSFFKVPHGPPAFRLIEWLGYFVCRTTSNTAIVIVSKRNTVSHNIYMTFSSTVASEETVSVEMSKFD